MKKKSMTTRFKERWLNLLEQPYGCEPKVMTVPYGCEPKVMTVPYGCESLSDLFVSDPLALIALQRIYFVIQF